ncbi:MAG: hypothetical protein OEX02_17440, partial [Cyclobacteriaceae bacterium]|nr:hypothetical protein [Cyclobacteriaceae bacterium]
MNAQETIKKIQNKAIRSYAFFTLLLALSIGLAVMSTLFILLERSMHLLMIPTVVFAFVMLAIYFVHSKADYLKPKQITQNLNMTRKEAEYSLELLLLDDDGLNDLQCIQKKIIGRRLFEIENKIPDVFDVKRQLYWFIPLLVVSATIYLAVPDIDPFTVKSHSLVFQDTVILQNEVIVDTTINMFPAFKWIISPPAYMKKPVSVQSAPELNVMEGSSLTLRMAGINNIRQPSLLLNNEKVILMSHADGQWEARVKAGQQSGFYQVAVRFADSTVSRSVYYPITVHRDEAPQIVVEGLADYQESSLSAGSIQFNVILADDHGVNEGHLLATVSKGEGENVKFRESIIPLDITRGSKRQLKKIELRFSDLSMENGDELYFFISARDNKSKGAQETRTSTYFIIIPDSTKESITLSSGLGVDRMPAYFRSQRQIIIDTEKLLEEKGKINTKEFNERSNNLAHDQKVLRLRYGRFLGEEFEIELGPSELHEEG